MRRPQFTIRTLMVVMLVVAVFFGGMAWQRSLDQRKRKAAVAPQPGTFQKDFTTPGMPSKTYSSKVSLPMPPGERQQAINALEDAIQAGTHPISTATQKAKEPGRSQPER